MALARYSNGRLSGLRDLCMFRWWRDVGCLRVVRDSGRAVAQFAIPAGDNGKDSGMLCRVDCRPVTAKMGRAVVRRARTRGKGSMWHDNETTIDYVNFSLVATACADLVRDANGEPISIGISGGWGVGKSSLVRMVANQLAESTEEIPTSRFLPLTFNPWLYQGFEDARTALLQKVGDAVLAQAEKTTTFVDKASGLLKRVNLLRLIQLGGEVAATVITGVPVGLLGKAAELGTAALREGSASKATKAVAALPDETKGLVKAAKPRSLPQEIQAFRESLEELLQDLEITLVIFVDDLDRCLPKTAISTLEAIHLLLFLRRTAFVVAADDAFIRGAVRLHFAGTGITDEVATNYFDKLIQIPLRVPRLGPNETKAYTALLFLEHAVKTNQMNAIAFEKARKSVAERLRASWRGAGVDLLFLESLVTADATELLSLMGLAERLAPMLVQATTVQSNPRLVKRFLNTVFLRKALGTPQGIDADIQVLAKWHLLERCDEGTANAIADRVSANTDGRVSVLREAEEAARTPDRKLPVPFGDKPFLLEWLQLPPSLGNSDLRPVLHLSRDTAIRDFGADDLGPAGAQLRDALVTAKAANTSLTTLIRTAGEPQAIIAMTRAWEVLTPQRSWEKPEEWLALAEVCKVYSGAGNRAGTLLSGAPVTKLSPAFVHGLLTCPWAATILSTWEKSADVPSTVKRAIAQGNK